MTAQSSVGVRGGNLILAFMPDDEYEILLPNLKEVSLKQGDVLHHPDTDAASVYFLNKGVASLSVYNADGINLELSMVGNEAAVGERAIFKQNNFIVQCQMLSDGYGYKIEPQIFQKEFYKCRSLHDLILNQLEARIIETSLTALCNQTHLMEQRLSRWLLTFADRSHSEKMRLTQDLISRLLGVNRPSISVAAAILQDKGLIDYQRGLITITDRKRLEKNACECYEAIKETVVTYLSLKRRP